MSSAHAESGANSSTRHTCVISPAPGPTESLDVVTPPDTAEIRQVTQAMRTEVLHV
jgi:hypothetical protein